MKKRILLTIAVVATLAISVIGMSAFEAHVINITVHIENALSVITTPIDFGTVFPQESLFSQPFTVDLSSSFLNGEQERVEQVNYKIEAKPKCQDAVGNYVLCVYNPASAKCECPADATTLNDLCKFLSVTTEETSDISRPSYFNNELLSCGAPNPAMAQGNLNKLLNDISDAWTVDLKVPPVAGYIGQDWPINCSGWVVEQNSQNYGCDLWVEVMGITAAGTDGPNSSQTIYFNNLGADPQYGYTHDYSGADVSFTYDTPTSGNLSGTINATGLKPYATYQLKFEGKPTCDYGPGGNNAANEAIGYLGRWWDNNLNANTTDAFYESASGHCITGYLVWDFITADSSGNASQAVITNNSYHVLYCSATCGDTDNLLLQPADASHPFPYCSAGNVNGQIERLTCDGLNLPNNNYDLRMILNEESFHQDFYGIWTAVMDSNINFTIN